MKNSCQSLLHSQKRKPKRILLLLLQKGGKRFLDRCNCAMLQDMERPCLIYAHPLVLAQGVIGNHFTVAVQWVRKTQKHMIELKCL